MTLREKGICMLMKSQSDQIWINPGGLSDEGSSTSVFRKRLMNENNNKRTIALMSKFDHNLLI